MWVLAHDQIEYICGCEHLECHGLLVLCYAYLQEVVVKTIQVTLNDVHMLSTLFQFY